MKLELKDLNNINHVAQTFLSLLAKKRIFAFYGSMGAGKTTFIKALCDLLGSIDVVTSPTFTLVNEYCTGSNDSIYHFDFYRLNKAEEALDLGFEEYLYSNKFCFIEWPERVEMLLPESTVSVNIMVNDDQTRTLEFEN